jgi:hypothetical protein
MRRTIKESLLREYVRQSIMTEDEGSGSDYAGYGDLATASALESPYGVSFGSAQDLKDAFITPFTDVLKTAAGATKEISRRAQTVLEVSFGTIVSTLIPFLDAKYASTFDKEKEDIEKIRGEYKEVSDRINSSLTTGDAAMLAFMAQPALVMGYYGAKATPKATKALMSTVSGGFSDKVVDNLVAAAKKTDRFVIGDDNPGGPRTSGGNEPKDRWNESQLREDGGEEGDKKGKKLTLKDILTNKKVVQKIAASPKAQELAKAATKVYRTTLQQVTQDAENVLKKSKTVEDVQKMTKKRIPEVDKLSKLNPEEKKKAEDFLLSNIRKSMKEYYVKNLEGQVKKVRDAGVPEDAQYVKDYQAVISKIKSM